MVSPKGWGDVKLWNLTNGLENEDLIVWMRTAAFPNFRKLYRKVVHVGEFEEGLPKNYSYRLRIDYSKLNYHNYIGALILKEIISMPLWT